MTMFAGLDVGFKRTAICVVDEGGEIVFAVARRAADELRSQVRELPEIDITCHPLNGLALRSIAVSYS